MPHPVVAGAGVAAVTLAVAAAIAIYESEDVRRVAEDIRRRIAVAFQSIGNEFGQPPNREPLFNRPEDAEGFLQSRGGEAAEPGVEADEASRKRQREELMYWNAIRESKLMAEEKAAQEAAVAAAIEYGQGVSAGSRNFEDFLRQDDGAAAGTFVFNTGAEVGNREGLSRRKGPNPAVYANPFADEHLIETDVEEASSASSKLDTDMYHATPRFTSPPVPVAAPTVPSIPEDLVPVPQVNASSSGSFVSATTPGTPRSASPVLAVEAAPSVRSVTMSGTAVDEELAEDEFMTAGQDRNAYSSIEAWAHGAQPDFYSPLPMSPEPPVSEPEMLSAGQLTPTDSVSVIDVDHEFENPSNAENRDFDVLSESEGIATPASWSEVGSVVSDSEPPMNA